MPLLYHLEEVVKTRVDNNLQFRLRIPDLKISKGEKIALIGESGSGKSTLLDILAMVLSPSSAEQFQFVPPKGATCDLKKIWRQHDQNRLSDLRREHIGYILQTGGLLPFLTVRQNIMLPRTLLGVADDKSIEFMADVLGIKRQLDKLPGALSVGERQRVAIARTLAHHPSIVFADEPTASLDPVNAAKTMTLLTELIDVLDITMIIASHDWQYMDKLGLRCLKQTFKHSHDGALIESIFTG